MKTLLLLIGVGYLGYSIGRGHLTYGKVKKVAFLTGHHVERAYNDFSNKITK